ncbi:hypothetical protein MesoLj131b_01270 [Mesorhizobium sp. 131-2-5]|uniref:hypothetical protein n=1 Tax=Mesorhizobium sp. 131-2-5 TaxID=2744519 RepID=UPI001925E48A|nr:hypothetical protein [Mesorhizobium sp. 131-2-5]BCG98127.1 hypothetical protein MesoLj131b_01270 [Mesorhizobium sp. 131-2-5]
MRKRPEKFDRRALRDAKALRRLGVQRVQSAEELSALHDARLARFARADVDEKEWKHLRHCRGAECPHPTCSAACVFGERKELNRVVRQTRRLLKSGQGSQRFVTIIDPTYFLPPGRLNEFSIGGLVQSLRRRLREAPDSWKSARIVGAVDMAYDRERNGHEWWAPHVHLAIVVDADAKEIKRVLKPRRAPPAEMVGRVFRPVVVKRITRLANAIGYSVKPSVEGRKAILDSRGNKNRKPFEIPAAAQLEHDLWLLKLKPRERSILSGMMMSRGGVVPRKRRS